jgi:hypothetical protein
MFKIEKRVPLPAEKASAAYPFAEMEKGDSFFVPSAKPNPAIAKAAHKWGKAHGVKFLCQREGEGYRIWHIGTTAEAVAAA